MSDALQQGIAALKEGDKLSARRLLGRAVQEDPRDVQAWLWLSGAVESDQERLACLQEVLAIDPANALARRGVAALENRLSRRPSQAPLVEPPPPAFTPITVDQLVEPPPVLEMLDHTKGLEQLLPEQRKALEGYTTLVAYELVHGHKQPEGLVERLTKRGFPRTAVRQFVDRVVQQQKQLQQERARRRRRR